MHGHTTNPIIPNAQKIFLGRRCYVLKNNCRGCSVYEGVVLDQAHVALSQGICTKYMVKSGAFPTDISDVLSASVVCNVQSLLVCPLDFGFRGGDNLFGFLICWWLSLLLINRRIFLLLLFNNFILQSTRNLFGRLHLDLLGPQICVEDFHTSTNVKIKRQAG